MGTPQTEFMGNLIKLVSWGSLGNLHPYTQGDEPKRVAAAFEQLAANNFRIQIFVLEKIPVDRTQPFDWDKMLNSPIHRGFDPQYMGTGWTIWKGPADGDGLSGEEEHDGRSLALTEMSVDQMVFEIPLRHPEDGGGEDARCRLKESGKILLDLRCGQALLHEQGQLTLEMLRITRGITTIFLPGTVLRRFDGRRNLFYLFFYNGEWRWSTRLVEAFWGTGDFCALLLNNNSSAAVSVS